MTRTPAPFLNCSFEIEPEVLLWTDQQLGLPWLKSPPKKVKIFGQKASKRLKLLMLLTTVGQEPS